MAIVCRRGNGAFVDGIALLEPTLSLVAAKALAISLCLELIGRWLMLWTKEGRDSNLLNWLDDLLSTSP
ncbi:conserved hypothetical protein [Ricinus communis]|uniref:Uncharacterized protein n=1 Tax=Ricinus communis TaxID=3988 RepID=B9R7M8_RICCO|nr:conserved hypothetical protein [Ricinus communis]